MPEVQPEDPRSASQQSTDPCVATGALALAPIADPSGLATTYPSPVAAPVPDEAAHSDWACLPHDLLVQIFAAQPEPLHNLGAEHTCRAWGHAVRQTGPGRDASIHAGRPAHLHVMSAPHARATKGLAAMSSMISTIPCTSAYRQRAA